MLKYTVRSLCFVVILLFGFGNNGMAFTLFQEDFENPDSISQWIQAGAQFSVQDFEGNKVLAGNGSGVAFVGGSDWKDYTVEGDYYLWNGSYWAYAFGLLFRAEGYWTNAYMLQLRPYAFEIERWAEGENWSYLASKSGSFSQPGKWYHLKVVCEGANIKAYADDVLIFDVNDPRPILRGGVGIRLWNAGAYLDNLKVTIPDINICAELANIKDQINSLPASAFKNNHENRKMAFSDKLDEVCSLVQSAQSSSDDIVRDQLLDEALEKLHADILAKMDSGTGGFSKNDWIEDEDSQSRIYPKIMVIVRAIEELR